MAYPCFWIWWGHILMDFRSWSIYGQISLLVVTLRLPIASRLTKTLVTIDLNVKQYLMKNKQAWASTEKIQGGAKSNFGRFLSMIIGTSFKGRKAYNKVSICAPLAPPLGTRIVINRSGAPLLFLEQRSRNRF